MTQTTHIADKDHAILGPSGWDRWSSCPGSVVLEEGRPNPTSSYAAWGTVAHEITAYCLENNCDAESFVGQVFTVEQHRFEVDMEMADACNDAVAVVRQFVPEGDVLMVEQEVPIGHLTGETGATGTADVVGVVAEGTRLVVIDHKFGKGVQVWASTEVESIYAEDEAGMNEYPQPNAVNGQLAMYALGALEKFGLIHDEIAEVELVVNQPRLDHVDSIVISVDELRAFGEEVTLAAGRVELARAVDQAVNIEGVADGELELNPSEKACKFCRAKAICPALQGEVEGSMALVSGQAGSSGFEDLTLPKKAAALARPVDVDNEKLAEAFRAIPLIETWIAAVGAEVDHRLHDRQVVPGLYLGEGRAGRRQWADSRKAEAELKRRYKVDEMYDKTVISPTKAEKLMKDKPRVWAKVVQEVGILQPVGKPKVCREGVDKNKLYQLPSADDFADLTAKPSLLDD
jgi:hypothetical protein